MSAGLPLATNAPLPARARPRQAAGWPAPGSTAWLIAHELRLVWREGSRAGRALRIGALLFLLLLPVGGGIALAWQWRDVTVLPPGTIGLLAAGWYGLLLLLLSAASMHVLRVFHDRGDLDLLLAAPLPPERVLAAKAVAVQIAVGTPMLAISLPFVLASMFFGHVGWIGITLMIAIGAALASAAAFVIAGGLFRRWGARRARMIIQVASGVFGVSLGVAGQSASFAPAWFRGTLDWLRQPPLPPFDWPAEAALGAPVPLLAFALLAWGATRASAREAADQMGAGSAADSLSLARPARFGGSPARVLLDKELRLLARDPELLATVLLQMAYMIPAFGLIFAGGASPGRLAAAVVLFAGLLAASLGWITICGEDAPDLVAAAPLPAVTVYRVKLAAACLPPLALLVVPIAGIALLSPVAALVAAVLAPVAALCGALQQGWAAKPQPRRAFYRRQRGSLLLALSEYALSGALSTAAVLLVAGSPWALVPFGVAALVLAIAWMTRLR